MNSFSYPVESGRPKLDHWCKTWKEVTYVNIESIEFLGNSSALDNI